MGCYISYTVHLFRKMLSGGTTNVNCRRAIARQKRNVGIDINSKESPMMPAQYSADLRWRVIWFVHILQDSVAEASYFLGVCERKVERNISKFLVNGHVKPGPAGRSYGSISLAPRKKLIVFAYQIWKPQFLSVVQFPFDKYHSPCTPTMFFEIDVHYLDYWLTQS